MSILIKGMEMPPKGEYEFTLYVDADVEAYLESPSTLFPENFECIEVPEDVAPVKHGEWKHVKWVKDDKDQGGGYWISRCSNCIIPYHSETPYCPHCGAKMDLLN